MIVIGVMSGTSLDGLDLACCRFESKGKWSFELQNAITIPYNHHWRRLLEGLQGVPGIDLIKADMDYGQYIGKEIVRFINNNGVKPDLIASHGHTVFHQPDKGFTLQVGNGHAIAAVTGIPVVYDFRSLDVALGGQGAPLVPLGDQILFSDYTCCLNLGGFANISFDQLIRGRVAFDICPVNIVLNYLAQKTGHLYDNKGEMASTGNLDFHLLERLNNLDYYSVNYPKSLGKEWVKQFIFPLIESSDIPVEDQLHTFSTHIAVQIAKSLEIIGSGQVLVTGGGAFNDFLIQTIRNHTRSELIIPENDLVNFKEAMVFGFLGLLRTRNEINCLRSVTGASKDSVCGLLVNPSH
ncbi:MAG: anhydro-N-acetylmuramic acid kinase [Bacteroidales bacterium]